METLRQCLQCWGVKHVETMFDNDGYEIDQCGGIPSYLKEKIDNIDCAILMFTQLFKGKDLVWTQTFSHTVMFKALLKASNNRSSVQTVWVGKCFEFYRIFYECGFWSINSADIF